MGQIEFVRDDKVRTLTFPLYPHCFRLNSELKAKFMKKMNFFSPQSKADSIIDNSE
jgi:hypothetical protein